MKEKNRKKESSLVKIDKNFLENPLFIINKENWEITKKIFKNEDNPKEEMVFIISKRVINENSYIEIITRDEPPNSKDYLILFSIIRFAQIAETNKITLTFTDIYKSCYKDEKPNKQDYEEIKKGLKKWAQSSVKFESCFYDNNKKVKDTRIFSSIIPYLRFIDTEGTKKIEIEISNAFMDVIETNKFYQKINLKNMASLKGDMTRKLYSILVKSFHENNYFTINWKKLKNKLESKLNYKSQFLLKIEKMIEEINKKTELEISYEVNGEIIIFRYNNEKQQITIRKFADYLFEKFQNVLGLTEEDYKKLIYNSKLEYVRSDLPEAGLLLKTDSKVVEKLKKDLKVYISVIMLAKEFGIKDIK